MMNVLGWCAAIAFGVYLFYRIVLKKDKSTLIAEQRNGWAASAQSNKQDRLEQFKKLIELADLESFIGLPTRFAIQFSITDDEQNVWLEKLKWHTQHSCDDSYTDTFDILYKAWSKNKTNLEIRTKIFSWLRPLSGKETAYEHQWLTVYKKLWRQAQDKLPNLELIDQLDTELEQTLTIIAANKILSGFDAWSEFAKCFVNYIERGDVYSIYGSDKALPKFIKKEHCHELAALILKNLANDISNHEQGYKALDTATEAQESSSQNVQKQREQILNSALHQPRTLEQYLSIWRLLRSDEKLLSQAQSFLKIKAETFLKANDKWSVNTRMLSQLENYPELYEIFIRELVQKYEGELGRLSSVYYKALENEDKKHELSHSILTVIYEKHLTSRINKMDKNEWYPFEMTVGKTLYEALRDYLREKPAGLQEYEKYRHRLK